MKTRKFFPPFSHEEKYLRNFAHIYAASINAYTENIELWLSGNGELLKTLRGRRFNVFFYKYGFLAGHTDTCEPSLDHSSRGPENVVSPSPCTGGRCQTRRKFRLGDIDKLFSSKNSFRRLFIVIH